MENPMLLAFYGDDFTGSTDVLESLSLAGIKTVLFLDMPGPEALQSFPGLQAIGVAGTSRSMTPPEMRTALPEVFQGLASFHPKVVLYKVCSTFDSSPTIGSIGLAIDLGRRALPTRWVPLVVGAPILGRYTAFGNLFARSGLDSEPYRLDRHPTMRHHPTTPMTESDLRLILAEQTDTPVVLLDLTQLALPDEQLERTLGWMEQPPAGYPPEGILLFDVLYDNHLPKIGRIIWKMAQRQRDRASGPLFAVGSSGLTYALTAHWSQTGVIPPGSRPRLGRPEGLQPLLVVSGSCSPVTAQQIQVASQHGFETLALDTPALVDPGAAEPTITRAVNWAVARLAAGRNVVLHTCLGPQDPRIVQTRDRLRSLGFGDQDGKWITARRIGRALGQLARRLADAAIIRCVVVVGGDTSGHAAREMGIQALEMEAPLAPGSPLCRIHAPGDPLHGVRAAFKGGQTGNRWFFVHLAENSGHLDQSEKIMGT